MSSDISFDIIKTFFLWTNAVYAAKFIVNLLLPELEGIANAIVSPAMEFKSEGLILGLGAKLFVIAGPVLVYGISASVIYGLILFLTGGGSV